MVDGVYSAFIFNTWVLESLFEGASPKRGTMVKTNKVCFQKFFIKLTPYYGRTYILAVKMNIVEIWILQLKMVLFGPGLYISNYFSKHLMCSIFGNTYNRMMKFFQSLNQKGRKVVQFLKQLIYLFIYLQFI